MGAKVAAPNPVRIHRAVHLRDGTVEASCHCRKAWRFTDNPFAVTCERCRWKYSPMGGK